MRRLLSFSLSLLLAGGLLGSCSNDDHGRHSDRPSGMPMSGGEIHMGGMHGTASPVAEGAREIAVVADDFAFDPDEITVRAGEEVAIVLSSVDILHDFTIDELDAHVAANRGETATGGLRADRLGSYTFYCAVAGHRAAGMQGTLVVEP